MDSNKFREKFGPWAVVTGASVGIGAEFVRQLAAQGLNIVLVSRRGHLMDSLAAQVMSQHGVQTRVLEVDLSVADNWRKICKATEQLDVGLLVNNAGVALLGAYLRHSVEDHISLINTNVTSVAALAHAFSQRFVNRHKNQNQNGDKIANGHGHGHGNEDGSGKRGGGVIFVSSVSKNPVPWLSTYSGSKAFLSNLAIALRHELAMYGVHILSLEPRAVDTDMTRGQWAQLGWKIIQPQIVVSRALLAVLENKMRLTVSAESTKEDAEDEAKAIHQVEIHLNNITSRAEKVWDSEMFQPSS